MFTTAFWRASASSRRKPKLLPAHQRSQFDAVPVIAGRGPRREALGVVVLWAREGPDAEDQQLESTRGKAGLHVLDFHPIQPVVNLPRSGVCAGRWYRVDCPQVDEGKGAYPRRNTPPLP